MQNLTLVGAHGAGQGPRWTYDSSVPKPAGTRWNGSEEESFYTPQQQAEYHINAQGESTALQNLLYVNGHQDTSCEFCELQNLMVGTNGAGIGPRWTYDSSMPKPAGVR